ncbi:Neurochondrin-domain-containing protein, partial [Gongronella butleri]
SDDTDVTTEALHIFIQVATAKDGLVRMLDPDVLKNILEVYSGTKQDSLRTLCSQVLSLVYTRSSEIWDHEEKKTAVASLSSALVYSLESTTLPILASMLHHAQDKLKVATLTLLYHVLAAVPAEIMAKVRRQMADGKRTKMLDSLYRGLRQILASKVGDKLRDEGLTVIVCALRYFGPDWLFSWLKQTTKIKAQDDPDYANAHFPVLLISLVSVEARVLLDQVQDQWIADHGGDGTSTSVAVNLQHQARHQAMIPVYFSLLEDAIEYLASQYADDDDDHAIDMDPAAVLKIRKALTEVMDVVMEITRFMQDTADNDQELQANPIAQACMRILSLWLAEEGFEI